MYQSNWWSELYIYLFSFAWYFLGLENPRLSQNRFFFLLRMRSKLVAVAEEQKYPRENRKSAC